MRQRGPRVPHCPTVPLLRLALLAAVLATRPAAAQLMPPGPGPGPGRMQPIPPAVEHVSPRVTGNPFTQVWRTVDYDAGPANTCVVQHPATGLIYAGNDEGVLEYDSARWRLLPLPKAGAVQALAIDAQQRVWIAADNEIARLEPDERGVLRAVTVQSELAAGEPGATSALAAPDGVWFGGRQHIVRFGPDGRTAAWLTSEHFGTLWWMDGALHTVVSDRDVVRLEPGGVLLPIFSRDRLRVPAMRASPFEVFAARQNGEHEWLLLTALGPVRWRSDLRTWRPLPMQPPLFRETEAIAATFLEGGGMAFTGPRGGIAIVSKEGRLQQLVDRMPTVVAPRVAHLSEDREGGIWLAARERIARVQLRSAFARHEEAHGLPSGPRQMLRHNGMLFVAHGESVSHYIEWPGHFPGTDGLRRGADALAVVDGRLMAAAAGLVELGGEPRGRVWSDAAITTLTGLRAAPGVLLAGDAQGLWLFRAEGGDWKRAGRLQHLAAAPTTIFDAGGGWVWGAAADGRIWRADFRAGLQLDAPVKMFGAAEGVPPPARGGRIRFFPLGDTVVAASAAWLRRYVPAADRFELETRIAGIHSAGTVGAEAVGANSDGTCWLRLGPPDRRILRVIPDGANRWRSEELAAPQLRDLPVVGLYQDGPTLWVLGKDLLVSVDLKWKPPLPLSPLTPRVRRVATENGVVVWGDGASAATAGVNWGGHPSLRFEFAAPHFSPDHRGRPFVQYRTQLAGLEADWTPWSAEAWRDFSQLPPGHFHFRVQATDLAGRTSPEVSLAFLVPAPWWRTPWAGAGYALGTVLAVAGIVTARTRALRQRAAELEGVIAARTAELAERNATLRAQNEELVRLRQLEADETAAARHAEEKARLEVLRYQLNPHFLYNALNSIYGLVLTTPRAAAGMVLRLAEFCRAALTRHEADTTTVGTCFERVRLYLAIEKVRWNDSLQIEIELDEAARDRRIPPFLLQPLVENAIKYGGSTSPDTLRVRVSARMEPGSGGAGAAAAAPDGGAAPRPEAPPDVLVMEVANTGEWVEPEVARARGNTGLGLSNLRQRLQRVFPHQHEIITGVTAGWVVVRLRITLPAEMSPSKVGVASPLPTTDS